MPKQERAETSHAIKYILCTGKCDAQLPKSVSRQINFGRFKTNAKSVKIYNNNELELKLQIKVHQSHNTTAFPHICIHKSDVNFQSDN